MRARFLLSCPLPPLSIYLSLSLCLSFSLSCFSLSLVIYLALPITQPLLPRALAPYPLDSEAEATEVKAFVQHLIAHLELRVRLFRFSDPATASLRSLELDCLS